LTAKTVGVLIATQPQEELRAEDALFVKQAGVLTARLRSLKWVVDVKVALFVVVDETLVVERPVVVVKTVLVIVVVADCKPLTEVVIK
jgi:hypothetical protein